jgi:hypothetical protein
MSEFRVWLILQFKLDHGLAYHNKLLTFMEPLNNRREALQMSTWVTSSKSLVFFLLIIIKVEILY